VFAEVRRIGCPTVSASRPRDLRSTSELFLAARVGVISDHSLLGFAVVQLEFGIAAESAGHCPFRPPDDMLPSVHFRFGVSTVALGIEAPALILPCRLRGFSPPCRFTPLLVFVAKNRWSCRFVAPCSHLRVRCVSGQTVLIHRSVSGTLRLPRIAVHTPRRIPLFDSRSVSPPPLPPCCFDSFEALLHRRVRNMCSAFTDQMPYPPWALFPSKVLQRTVTSKCAVRRRLTRCPEPVASTSAGERW
jgi:hypothetical protein